MTQITQEQEQWRTAAEQAGAKLGSFLSGLPDDEQQILTIALSVASSTLARLADDGQGGADVEGHSLNLANGLIRSVQENPRAWMAAGLALDGAARAAGGNWAVVWRWANNN